MAAMAHKIRRRFFTLLEVLIALSLAVMITGVLLYYYYQMSQVSALSDKATQRAFQMRYLQDRLQDLTLRMSPPKDKNSYFFLGSNAPGIFQSEGANLIFSYNNGVVFDQNLSNEVLGRLFVDPKGKLTLMTWPSRDKWEAHTIPPFHKEILAENIQKIEFDFFTGASDPREQNPFDLAPGRWEHNWRREFKALPAMIRFKVTPMNQEKPIIFAYPLSGKQTVVNYRT